MRRKLYQRTSLSVSSAAKSSRIDTSSTSTTATVTDWTFNDSIIFDAHVNLFIYLFIFLDIESSLGVRFGGPIISNGHSSGDRPLLFITHERR